MSTSARVAERDDPEAVWSIALGTISAVAPWLGFMMLGMLGFVVNPVFAAVGLRCGLRARSRGAGPLAFAGIVLSTIGLTFSLLMLVVFAAFITRQ